MAHATDHAPAPASLGARLAQIAPTLVLDALLPAILYGVGCVPADTRPGEASHD
jgi:hypothetical protein